MTYLIPLIAAGVGFYAGFVVKSKRFARAQITTRIPEMVMFHKWLANGETNRAMTGFKVMILGAVTRYDSLKRDKIFTYVNGRQAFDSPDFLKSLAEARSIANQQKLKMVVISPDDVSPFTNQSGIRTNSVFR